VTLQTSATTAAQFTVGRIINFAMTGFCIVVTPIYQSECAPAYLRGMISATIQFQISFGQTVASLINFGTQNMKGDKSWQIPIGLQFIVPVVILALLPLMPESPRW
jgi:MFS transporter, SP family, sugar:H+ symporter